ncbi:hypothetical protein HPB48_004758 [Haemaphysalis longicornis]|uniref:DM domain-containing protein n=1 Tax=Haemaphysalis longicornis TaxID=44386 RepID=A0A9J6G145_HAELO|nr:hypothetical protein HPB48_004758 [Haemaphysalis longicornis]
MVRQELNLTIAHSPDGGVKQSSVNGTGGAMQGGGAGGTAGSSPAAAATVAAPAPAARTPSGRTPNCARCKNHNKTVLLRGHKRYCPYVDCVCDRCTLIAKRQVVMAKQVALRRAQALDEAMGRTVIEEVDPEELKLAAESGSMPPGNRFTPPYVPPLKHAAGPVAGSSLGNSQTGRVPPFRAAHRSWLMHSVRRFPGFYVTIQCTSRNLYAIYLDFDLRLG